MTPRNWARLLVVFILAVQVLPLSGDERRRANPSVFGPRRYVPGLEGVTALVAAPDGSVWFIPYQIFSYYNFVGHLSVDGTLLRTPIDDPGVAVTDSDGSLWLGAGKAIARIHEGTPIAFFPRSGPISGIASDRTGRIWFTDERQSRVGFVNVETATTTEFSLPESLASPRLISPGPDGSMWFVADTGRVGSVRADGIIEGYRFQELEEKPIHAVTSTPGAFWVAVGCRNCNNVFCPHAEDHGLIVRITADHVSQIVADLGHNDPYALAPGPSETVYALKTVLAVSLGGKAFSGPLLVIRPNGSIGVFDAGVPVGEVSGACLATSPDGSVWGVYTGGGGGPVIFHFPAWQIR